jgi:16S rRNA (uracil1498-N3)-methyltransferase
MELFYANHIEDNKIYLDEQESTHCIRVLRHQAGDELLVTDGNGNKFAAKIENAHPKKCVLQIESKQSELPRNYYLHIAIAPPKSIDRFEWFLEKATELGIEEITPLHCRYSERKHLNQERCTKILISAMKQSNRLFLPKLNAMVNYDSFLKNQFDSLTCIAHCETTVKLKLMEVKSSSNKLLMLIGPEGDFSKEEIQLALAADFQPISLGEKRLRTETAAIHVSSVIASLNG